jgi:hypothetical protein
MYKCKIYTRLTEVVHVASNRRAGHDRLPTRGATALIAAAPAIGRPCSAWAAAAASFHIYILFCPLLPRPRPNPAFLPAYSPSPALPGRLSPGFSTVACAPRPPVPRLFHRRLRSPVAFPSCRRKRINSLSLCDRA